MKEARVEMINYSSLLIINFLKGLKLEIYVKYGIIFSIIYIWGYHYGKIFYRL